MTEPSAEAVVTRADRVAADDFAGLIYMSVLQHNALVQAFARHRIAAGIAAAEREAAKDAEIARLDAECSMLAAGACIYPHGNGLFGDDHGNSFCGVERERVRLDQRETDLMAEINAKEATIATLRADVAELVGVLSDAVEELKYFIEFAVRQCEFEGDEDAALAIIRVAADLLAKHGASNHVE